METMLDKQINSAERMKSTTECIIDDVESNVDYLGQAMQSCARASLDRRPASDLLNSLKEAASKAEELRIQAIADSAFYAQYKLQHDQQEDDTEDEEE